jgi:DNA gyrase subunit B
MPTRVDVTLLPDGGVRVVDNGRGIPTDIHPQEGMSAVELVLTQLHAGGKFGGGGYKVSGGLHGVGSSVVNALSSRLVVEVRQKGHVFRMAFALGVPVAPLEKMEATDETGTTITFWPSNDIFETTTYDFETIRARFQQIRLPQQGPHDHPHRRAAAGRRGRRGPRGRDAVEHRLLASRSTPSPTRSTPTRAAPTKRASGPR